MDQEQQPETDAQFHAFEHFRGLEPGQRSITKAWRSHKHDCEGVEDPSGSAAPNWYGWSRDHDWRERVREEEEDYRQAHLDAMRQARIRADLEDLELANEGLQFVRQGLAVADPEEATVAQLGQLGKIWTSIRRNALEPYSDKDRDKIDEVINVNIDLGRGEDED